MDRSCSDMYIFLAYPVRCSGQLNIVAVAFKICCQLKQINYTEKQFINFNLGENCNSEMQICRVC